MEKAFKLKLFRRSLGYFIHKFLSDESVNHYYFLFTFGRSKLQEKALDSPEPLRSSASAGGLLLTMTGAASDLSEGRRRLSDAVIGGAALSKFQAMMEAQGVAKETAEELCSAHTDYFKVFRKSEHQMELTAAADGENRSFQSSVQCFCGIHVS